MMNATAFQRAIERTMRAKTTSEIDEAATPLADYRDGLENGTEEIGAIATDKTLLGLARVYASSSATAAAASTPTTTTRPSAT